MGLGLGGEMEEVSYFGGGGEENYWEGNNGRLVGEYEGRGEEMYLGYVGGEEKGDDRDRGWLMVKKKKGKGVGVYGDGRLEFN